MTSSFPIGLTQQENNLLAREILLFETSFCAVKIFDRVAFFEPALERLEHDCVDLPILVAADAIGYLRMLDANVRDDGDRFVIRSKIAKRRPIVVVLSERDGDKKDQNLKHRGNVNPVRQDLQD